jgi:ferredoxin
VEITVSVNRYRCKAMQKCVQLMPGAFEMGAGYSKLTRTDFSEEELAQLKKVAASCPSRAISVQIEDDEDEA